MSERRFSRRIAALALLALLFVALPACDAGLHPLLYDVSVSPDVISPNADGMEDVTRITYRLSESANLSIYLVDEAGEKHYFRKDRRRSPGDYAVDFGGVVDGAMLPDGDYTWVVEATDDAGDTLSEKGALVIRGADTEKPVLEGFSVYPQVFTPNQDGIDDRVTINYYLTKEADVTVYLYSPEGDKYPVGETEREVEPGEVGFHTYDYEGGVDLGADPPPDGDYVVRAEAVDRVGNRTVITSQLTINEGGVPRANIVQASVEFYNPETGTKVVPLGGTLAFTATVENFGAVPIRTTGPEPGTLYRSDENFNRLGWYEEPGAWRFGIDYETNSSGRPYPYRFAVGSRSNLTKVERNGETYWYLMPGERAVITGEIQIVDEPPRNPIYFWGGLIHEDVRISTFNDHVDPQQISIGF